MTLDEFKNKNKNKKDSGHYIENQKIALTIQKFYNLKCESFHQDDSSSELWERVASDWKGEKFSNWISDLVEYIDDFYFYRKGRLPYALENMLFRLSLIAKDYQNNKNETVREFLSLDFSQFMSFIRENMWDDYYATFSVQLLDKKFFYDTETYNNTLGNVLNDAYNMWYRSTYHNMAAKEAVILIMFYPFMIAFQSSRCKQDFYALLKTD